MKTKLFSVIALILILAITSCKKDAGPKGDKGDTGAQGVAGTNGINGTNGSNGTNGTNGTNGVANIQVYIATTANGSWALNSSDNSWAATLNATAVTSTVVSSGDVRVFLGDGTGLQWTAMPFSYGMLQVQYWYQAGSISVSFGRSDFTAIANPGGQQFKYVIIPPAYKVKYPNVNWNDYNQVMALLNTK